MVLRRAKRLYGGHCEFQGRVLRFHTVGRDTDNGHVRVELGQGGQDRGGVAVVQVHAHVVLEASA